MLGLCWCWSYVGSNLGHVGSMLGLRGALPGPRRLMFDQNWGSVGPYWGCVGAVTRWAGLCWPILGLCWPSCGLCWGQVRPSWGYVGAMLAHLESMLGPCSPILMPPRRWFWGYVVFMSSPSFPNFAWKRSPQWPARHPLHLCNTISLKKLNPAWDGTSPMSAWRLPPVAYEVPGNASQGVGGTTRSPLNKARFASATLPPVTCEFHTSGLRIAQASERGSAA